MSHVPATLDSFVLNTGDPPPPTLPRFIAMEVRGSGYFNFYRREGEAYIRHDVDGAVRVCSGKDKATLYLSSLYQTETQP